MLFDYLPDSLKLILRKMFVGAEIDKLKMKISGIGHAIIQAARPKAVLAPLQIAFGVQMHHHHQSKYLIESLHALGFSSSYKEVLMLERNAAMDCNVGLAGCFGDEGSFVKFSADNVDHNTCTLDGRNTFHGMGMIASITKGKFIRQDISREKVSNKELLTKSHAQILPFNESKHLLKGIKYETLRKVVLTSSFLDLLWSLSYFFKNPTPIWSGIMQILHESSNKEQYKADNIVFLPIIDLNPTNMSCIFSTLSFLSNFAHKNNQPTIVAFDQPLYWKGSQIIIESSDLLVNEITLMLENFHTILNLLGCVGKLMDGTGLSTILTEIYGQSTVNQMMSGKAYSRALRGHLIVDQVLSVLLCEKMTEESNQNLNSISVNLEMLHNNLLLSKQNISDLSSDPLLSSIHS